MFDIFFSESAAHTRYLMSLEPADRDCLMPEWELDSIIYLPFLFDIGDLSIPIISNQRKELFCALRSYGRTSFEEIESCWERYIYQLKRLEEEAKKGTRFRIWYSNSANDLCGLYYVCALLNKYEVEVSVIKLPTYQMKPSGVMVSYRLWNEVHLEDFEQFMESERVLSSQEISIFAMMWKNSLNSYPLRVVLEGNVIGVSEDFYDSLIWMQVSNEPFSVSELIGQIISEYQLGIDEGCYARRICQMIERGQLVVVKSEESFYEQVLQKVD